MLYQTSDRLPVYEESLWALENAWRQRYQPAPDVTLEDFYWQDLSIQVAREELFSTQIRDIRADGEWVLRDDGWGRTVRIKPGTYFCEPVERMLTDPSKFDQIEFDSPALDERYTTFLRNVEILRRKNRPVFAKIGGPFIRCSYFRGETEFLMDLAADEAFARTLVERVGEHLLQIALESMRRGNLQDTGVWIFDDMCNLKAPMFSPASFERIFLPVYCHMVKALKQAGAKWVFLHCDGNLRPFLDMLVDAGIDGINPVEYSAGLDVVELIETYQGRLRFVGGVCNTHILPGGNREDIEKHVTRIINAARGGGIVIGTHSVGPDISLDSYETYRNIITEQGCYKANAIG